MTSLKLETQLREIMELILGILEVMKLKCCHFQFQLVLLFEVHQQELFSSEFYLLPNSKQLFHKKNNISTYDQLVGFQIVQPITL